MNEQRNRPDADKRTDDLYPAMKRHSDGTAAHTPDTSGNKPSGSGEAAALEDRLEDRKQQE